MKIRTREMAPVALQILLGMFTADFSAAFFHWWEDTYFTYQYDPEKEPGGPDAPYSFLRLLLHPVYSIAKDNEFHHYYPRGMVSYPWYENCVVTTIIACAVVFLVYMVCGDAHLRRYAWFYGSFFLFGCLANAFHSWAHLRKCETPLPLAVLYEWNLLVDHEHHSKHHADPAQKYAIIFPLTNTLLDGLRIFPFIEFLVEKTTGIAPQKKIKYIEYTPIKNRVHVETESQSCPRRLRREEVDELRRTLDVRLGPQATVGGAAPHTPRWG